MAKKLVEVKCECGQEDEVNKSWVCTSCNTWNEFDKKEDKETKPKGKKGWLS